MRDTLSQAERLEELLPEVLRTLFPGVEDEPLSDLPLSQMRVLRQLQTESKSPTDLACTLGISLSAVIQLVSKLESAELVNKTCTEGDKRCRSVSLSDHGRRLMSERRRSRAHRAAVVLAGVDPESRDALIQALEGVLTAARTS